VSVTVRVNDLTLSHKGSNGFSNATLPDVCKTPTPGGPVPMPYTNYAQSSDLADGTKTVTADGGNMIAIKGSHYSISVGDEPGTVGGIASNTFKKETDWITYSFDVKMDGGNACRLTDKKFHNHKNTVDALGDVETPLSPEERAVKCAIHQCDNRSYNLGTPPPPAEEACRLLGTKKHTCVAEKLKDKEPEILSETFVDMTVDPPNVMQGVKNFFHARAKIGQANGYKPGSLRRPDVVIQKDGKRQVIDAKFPCPDDVASGTKSRGVMKSPQSSASMLTGEQKDDYEAIQNNGQPPQEIQPSDCSSKDCAKGGKK
jgi:Domain of unknown function (DUF4150)